MAENLEVTIEDRIARILFNRPESFNSMDSGVLFELARRLQSLAVNDSVQAVVITGAGKAFSSGADLKSVGKDSRSPSEILYSMASVLHQSTIELRRIRKPVIAAINGVAAGAGFSLALACDFRIMAKSAVLRQAYTSWGLCIDGGGTFMLPRLVGLARALEIAAFDPPITSEMALQWGLVNRVVEDDQVVDAALAMARELMGRSLHSFGQAKELLTDSLSTPLEVQLENERMAIHACAIHPDGIEGVTAFATKRKPVYNKNA
jgi:2-(1,2-epoxy-1,2-dihydrophenyl)acetyl-CoA isomerase